MKFAKVIFVLFNIVSLISVARASNELNHLSCIYTHDDLGWGLSYFQYSKVFNLANKESRMLFGGWTTGGFRNHAVCTEMVGTTSDDIVEIKSMTFKGDIIDTIEDNCDVRGENIVTLSEVLVSVDRGSYSQLVSNWLILPNPNKIMIRTYFPKLDEVHKIEDLSEQICTLIHP